MNHSTSFTAEPNQTDDGIFDEVSDEALEVAAGTYVGDRSMLTVGPTIIIGGCC